MSSDLQFVSQPGFKCDANWHLRKYGLQLAIYNKVGALTRDKQPDGTYTYREYYGGVDDMADFFYSIASDGEYQAMWEAFKQLQIKEWLKKLPATKRIAALEDGEERPGVKYDIKGTRFRPKNYLYVPHDEWAFDHPGQCYVDPEAAPWHVDGSIPDRLAAQLFRMSSGKLKWPESVMVRLRKSGLTDEAIAGSWDSSLPARKSNPGQSGIGRPCDGSLSGHSGCNLNERERPQKQKPCRAAQVTT